jgi:Interleukin-like EMT inducer
LFTWIKILNTAMLSDRIQCFKTLVCMQCARSKPWPGASMMFLKITVTLLSAAISTAAELSVPILVNTWGSTTSSDNMATYINSLPLNTVLIGVTADEAKSSLTYKATNALLAIGVDVTGLQVRGKLSFVARIGQPTVTVYQVAPPGGGSVKITANMTGTSNNQSMFV